MSQTLSYAWEMTGTTTDVNQSGTVTAGSATLTILDDAGTEVYTGDLTDTERSRRTPASREPGPSA